MDKPIDSRMHLVELLDGTKVSSSSEEWRHLCEARAIMAMPNKGSRRAYLDGWTEYDGRPPHQRVIKHKGILQHRGIAEVKRLEATIMAIWQQKQDAKVKQAQTMPDDG